MKKIIALDAGHGSDTWFNGGGKGVRYDNGKVFEEHSFNAAVVKYAKELAEYNGLEVMLTQPLNQKDVPLTQRTNLARNKKVDLLISFHADASSDTNVRGHWCFFWTGHEPSGRLALIWDKNADVLMNETLDRNTRESVAGTWTEFHMCREPVRYGIPSILIEHAYMTNRKDLELLMSDSFRRKCAETAIKSVCEFLGLEFRSLNKSEEEVKMITELQKQVGQLQKQVEVLEKQNKMPEIPKWAVDVVNKLVDEKVMLEPNGRSYDLYSILAILARKGVI